MSGSSAHLTLFPERCDGCGACRGVCSTGALKVGEAFIYVDWRRCDGCRACVEVCDRNAIVTRTVPLRSSSAVSTVPLSEVGKVVVGSRAEAKAVRKAAEIAAKAKKSGKPKAAVSKPGKTVHDAGRSAKAAFPERAEPGAPLKRAIALRLRPKPPGPAGIPKQSGLAADSGSPTRWSLVDAAAVLAIALAALLAKNAVLGLGQVELMPALGRSAVRVATLVAFYVVQFAAFGWLAARHGRPALEALGLRRGVGKPAGDDRPSLLGSAGLVVALAVGCEAVSVGYGLAMRAFGAAAPAMLSSDLSRAFGAGPVGLAAAAVLVAIAAPFAEEIAFRGIVLPALGDRWGAWVGIGGSALLFAAYHLQPWLAFPMLVFGAALGWLTWTRRALWPAIALHVVFNAVSVFAAFAGSR